MIHQNCVSQLYFRSEETTGNKHKSQIAEISRKFSIRVPILKLWIPKISIVAKFWLLLKMLYICRKKLNNFIRIREKWIRLNYTLRIFGFHLGPNEDSGLETIRSQWCPSHRVWTSPVYTIFLAISTSIDPWRRLVLQYPVPPDNVQPGSSPEVIFRSSILMVLLSQQQPQSISLLAACVSKILNKGLLSEEGLDLYSLYMMEIWSNQRFQAWKLALCSL